MQANMEGPGVDVKLKGTMANFFAKVDPKLYRKYVMTERVTYVVYVWLNNIV